MHVSPRESGRVAITGANGSLGRRLIERLTDSRDDARPVRAIVRSERAARTIRESPGAAAAEVVTLEYSDADALAEATRDCDAVVHLVGILKEGATSSYVQAHEESSAVLAAAAAREGVRRIVYLSILGSAPAAGNACLASKGRAEQILLGGSVSTVVLRVPMVLGPGDYASAALRAQARARIVPLLRGGAGREQPIDANDVVSAVIRAIDLEDEGSLALDLAGPESLSRRELLDRSAVLHDNHPRVLPLPFWALYAMAFALERLGANPPLTRGMLGVLDHDDDIDPSLACERLGLELTPLDATLAKCVGPERTDP